MKFHSSSGNSFLKSGAERHLVHNTLLYYTVEGGLVLAGGGKHNTDWLFMRQIVVLNSCVSIGSFLPNGY